MTGADRQGPRARWVNLILLGLACAVFVSLIALGNWQMRRLAWKTDLIAAVESRAFATPIQAPANAIPPEYTRVAAAGTFQHALSQRVKAVTDLGLGHWIMTPLSTPDQTIWVNRGFVPSGFDSDTWDELHDEQNISGLVRHTRPGGTLLERNDTEKGRWVSVDLDLLSQHVKIAAAPYYIDADHIGAPGTWPRGGLTKLEFRNTHFSYAMTWYAMAALFLAGMVYVVRDLWLARKRAAG